MDPAAVAHHKSAVFEQLHHVEIAHRINRDKAEFYSVGSQHFLGAGVEGQHDVHGAGEIVEGPDDSGEARQVVGIFLVVKGHQYEGASLEP